MLRQTLPVTPMPVDIETYPVEEITEQYETTDLTDGHSFSADTIETFLQWGDDQDLHSGDAADMETYDEAYGVTDIFPALKTPAEDIYEDSIDELTESGDLDPGMVDAEGAVYRRIVPGAQLFATAVHTADPIERIKEVSFEEPVYEGEEVRLEEDRNGNTTAYTFLKEDAVTGETVENGSMTAICGGTSYNDVFSTLVPIGMGQWDRTGDVLLGYADMEADATMDELPSKMKFEGTPDDDNNRKGVQKHERRFLDDGTVLSYVETDLHLA